MKKFKDSWEIQHNWQLIFPLFGIVGLAYSSLKLSKVITNSNLLITIALSGLIFIILLKIILFLFKKLQYKWALKYRWELIRVFLVFAVTGTSSLIIGRPIIKLIGITKENLNPILYWILFIIIATIFYQILLVIFGWLFGQFKFFWEFEKKMLRRFGLKRFLD
jgi:uncharacterized protein YacL